MTEVKLATICCFMLALLDEVEDKGNEAIHIRKRCKQYIDKHPKHLDIIANTAWEVACTYTEDAPIWNPAVTLIMLWNNFSAELKSKVKLNTKFGETLYNKQNCTLQCKIDSKRIALDCVKAINKVIYDNKEILV